MAGAEQLEAVRQLVRESVAAVDALTPGALQAVLPALRAARDELRNELKTWLATAQNGADRFTAFEKARALRALEASFDRIAELRPAMASALAKGRQTTGAVAVANLDTEIQRLSAIFGGGIPTIPQINTAAIVAKGNNLLWKRHERSAARYAGAVGEDLRKQLAIGVAKGETFEGLVNRLRKLGNPAAKNAPIDPGADAAGIADGLFRRHRWWAERLVRTEGMNAYNVEHDAAIGYANENRPDGDEEFLRRWDAAADFRVCVLCAGLDGTVTTIGGTFKGGIANPPLHPCCRCVVLAWLRRWGDLKGETQARGAMPPPGKIMVGAEPEPRARQPKPPRAPPEPAREPATPRAAATSAVEPPPVIWEHKKNPKRVEAAKKAAEASVERRREIHSAVASNLPQELQSTWDKEGHKFMQQEARRIRGEKDRINAASKISEAFAEQYGSGSETTRGYEGDRYHRRAEIEAKHAETWADEQERKYYAAAAREEQRRQPAPAATREKRRPTHDDDVPF